HRADSCATDNGTGVTDPDELPEDEYDAAEIVCLGQGLSGQPLEDCIEDVLNGTDDDAGDTGDSEDNLDGEDGDAGTCSAASTPIFT
ncbi:hypothetical protein KIPB_015682, partial [Kipferlia bialata]